MALQHDSSPTEEWSTHVLDDDAGQAHLEGMTDMLSSLRNLHTGEENHQELKHPELTFLCSSDEDIIPPLSRQISSMNHVGAGVMSSHCMPDCDPVHPSSLPRSPRSLQHPSHPSLSPRGLGEGAQGGMRDAPQNNPAMDSDGHDVLGPFALRPQADIGVEPSHPDQHSLDNMFVVPQCDPIWVSGGVLTSYSARGNLDFDPVLATLGAQVVPQMPRGSMLTMAHLGQDASSMDSIGVGSLPANSMSEWSGLPTLTLAVEPTSTWEQPRFLSAADLVIGFGATAGPRTCARPPPRHSHSFILPATHSVVSDAHPSFDRSPSSGFDRRVELSRFGGLDGLDRGPGNHLQHSSTSLAGSARGEGLLERGRARKRGPPARAASVPSWAPRALGLQAVPAGTEEAASPREDDATQPSDGLAQSRAQAVLHYLEKQAGSTTRVRYELRKTNTRDIDNRSRLRGKFVKKEDQHLYPAFFANEREQEGSSQGGGASSLMGQAGTLSPYLDLDEDLDMSPVVKAARGMEQEQERVDDTHVELFGSL